MKKHKRKKRHHQTSYKERKQSTCSSDDCIEAKNAFIRNVSHEIRTPMNAIMGFSQMLKSSELNPQQMDYVDVILDSGNKLLLILENLLDLSNLQLGKVHLQTTECDLKKLLTMVWEHYLPKITAKNLQPILDLQKDLPTVLMDCHKLERVLGFVLSNAIKFTNLGSICLRANCNETDERLWLDISVEDTGCGIEEDRIKHIFEAFEQADNSMTRAFSGLGLGLGLSSRIIELLGGEISVSSVPNEGSVFHLRIPAEKI